LKVNGDTTMKGVILHGGAGTRLRPLTQTGPKQLIPIANKPISQYVLEDLMNSGILDIAIILGNTYPEKVKEYYGNGSSFNTKLTYIFQGEPEGIAHAIGLCKEYVAEESFVAYLGDNLLKGGIQKNVQHFEKSDRDAMILLCKVKEPQRFGVAEFDENNKLIRLVEKPKVPPSNYVLTGIYLFTPVIFDMIEKLKPSWRGELEITEAIQLLLNEGYNVGYDFVRGWWKDTGMPEDILEANRLVLDGIRPEIKGEVEDEKSIQGRVSIDENTIIEKGAVVRGPAIIGSNVTIKSNVYVGPYTSIASNVAFKRGEIENSIVMDNCIIDVDERIVDSLIGPYTKISSNNENRPKGRKFILGERSCLEL